MLNGRKIAKENKVEITWKELKEWFEKKHRLTKGGVDRVKVYGFARGIKVEFTFGFFKTRSELRKCLTAEK